MGTRVMAVVGVVAAVVGAVFTLQGIGVLGGSFMSGSGIWAVIGIALVVTGLTLYARATRAPWMAMLSRQPSCGAGQPQDPDLGHILVGVRRRGDPDASLVRADDGRSRHVVPVGNEPDRELGCSGSQPVPQIEIRPL